MIEIAFSLFDKYGTYSKYVGAAICSVLENTSAMTHIHILHDETLNAVNKEKFIKLCDKYGAVISFYEIKLTEEMHSLDAIEHFTIGTFFRLKLPDVLSDSVDKVLYLDADIIVNLDVEELWNIDIEDNYILAKCDIDTVKLLPKKSRILFDKGLFKEEEYFNAGVAVWNLKEIRKDMDFYAQAVEFLKRHPYSPFGDQDPTNYLFKGRIGFFGEKYNYFTLRNRGKGLLPERVIYHFAADHPYTVQSECFDRLFYEYLLKTPWGESVDLAEFYTEQLKFRCDRFKDLQDYVKYSRNRKIVFFGASSVITDLVLSHFEVENGDICFTDNDPNLWGSYKYNIKIEQPSESVFEGAYVVILSVLHYREISKQLEEYGLEETKDYINGRLLLREDEYGSYVL